MSSRCEHLSLYYVHRDCHPLRSLRSHCHFAVNRKGYRGMYIECKLNL